MIASGVVVYVSCQPVDFRKGAASLMALGLEHMHHALTAAADPSPASNQGRVAKQGRFDRQRVVARRAFCQIDALDIEVIGFRAHAGRVAKTGCRRPTTVMNKSRRRWRRKARPLEHGSDHLDRLDANQPHAAPIAIPIAMPTGTLSKTVAPRTAPTPIPIPKAIAVASVRPEQTIWPHLVRFQSGFIHFVGRGHSDEEDS